MTYDLLLTGKTQTITRRLYTPLKELVEGNNRFIIDTNALMDFTLNDWFNEAEVNSNDSHFISQVYESNIILLDRIVRLMSENPDKLLVAKNVINEFTGKGFKKGRGKNFLYEIEKSSEKLNIEGDQFFKGDYLSEVEKFYNKVQKLDTLKESDLYHLIFGYVSTFDKYLNLGKTIADKSCVTSTITSALENDLEQSILLTSDYGVTKLLMATTNYLGTKLVQPTKTLIKYFGDKKGTVVKTMNVHKKQLKSSYSTNHKKNGWHSELIEILNEYGHLLEKDLFDIEVRIKDSLKKFKIELKEKEKANKEKDKLEKQVKKEENFELIKNTKVNTLEKKMENKDYNMERNTLDRMYEKIDRTNLEEKKPEELRINYEDLNSIITFSDMVGYTNLKENAEFQALFIRENVSKKISTLNEDINSLEEMIRDTAVTLATNHDHSKLEEIKQYSEEIELLDEEKKLYDFISFEENIKVEFPEGIDSNRVYLKKELAEKYEVTPQSIANYVKAYPGCVTNPEDNKNFNATDKVYLDAYFTGATPSTLSKDLKATSTTIKKKILDNLEEKKDYFAFSSGKVMNIKVLPEGVEKLKEIMNR